jgi:plasmid stabilization system protein ParE
MPRIRLFHWNAQETEAFIEALRAAGHQVAYDEKIGPGLFPKIRASPPDAFVIALTRLPSQGREVAAFLRGSKATRPIPIVFVDGAPEKVESIRRQIPDAAYTSLRRLGPALQKALTNPPAMPIVPPQMMERYGTRTTAQKLGIVKGTSVGLLDPPRDYESVLGPMPDSVSFIEGAARNCQVTLWFVTDAGLYQSRLPHARVIGARTKLWILWPKGGQRTGISPPYLRETAKSVGLVDYKICSVNDRWSAMAFAGKKA